VAREQKSSTRVIGHPSRLGAIVLPRKAGLLSGGPTPQSPFEGLQVTDDGKTVLVTNRLTDPTAGNGGPAVDAATRAQLVQMLQALRVVHRVTAPFRVLEHNATNVEGDTLVWDYDVARLTSITAAQLKQGIRVRYSK
jgi:hypothetical protein